MTELNTFVRYKMKISKPIYFYLTATTEMILKKNLFFIHSSNKTKRYLKINKPNKIIWKATWQNPVKL